MSFVKIGKSVYNVDHITRICPAFAGQVGEDDHYTQSIHKNHPTNRYVTNFVRKHLSPDDLRDLGFHVIKERGQFKLSIFKTIDGRRVEDAHYHLPLENYGKIVAYYVCTDEPESGLNGGAVDTLITKEEGIELTRKLGINVEED